MSRIHPISVCLFGMVLLTSPHLLAGQRTENAATVVYPADYFQQNQPDTAYDMILLVPGFTLEEGDQVRGFAGAAGNVLINGKRPSTKIDTLADALKRIAASSVERIEVIRGDVPGIDMQGHTVLANVVLRAATTELSANSEVDYFGDHRFGSSIRIDGARRDEDNSLEGSLLIFRHENPNAGSGLRDLFGPSGRPVALSRATILEPTMAIEPRLGYQQPLWGGTLRLKASLTAGNDKLSEMDQVFAGAIAPLINARTSEFKTIQAEFSADLTKRLTPADELQLIVVQNGEHSQDIGAALQDEIPESTKEDAKQAESILRETVKHSFSDAATLEYGGEYDLNVLHARDRLQINGMNIALPSADVTVRENRAETFATLTWQFTPTWTIEEGARFEASHISETGDTDQSHGFFFAKPRFTSTWTPFDGDQVRLRVERTASQLDFQQFATVASFDTGNVTAGNPQLQPETDWIFEAAYEHRFWDTGTAVLTVSHAILENVIDDVPVADFSAPGNIGGGRRETVGLDLTIPLANVGLPDGLLKTSAVWKFSEVTDPTTGVRRPISLEQPFSGTLSLTDDIPSLRSNLAFNVTFGYEQPTFLVDQIQRERFETEYGVRWEFKLDPTLSIQTELQNFTSRQHLRNRLIFDGPRDDSPLAFIERLAIANGPRLLLSIRKTF